MLKEIDRERRGECMCKGVINLSFTTYLRYRFDYSNPLLKIDNHRGGFTAGGEGLGLSLPSNVS